MKARKKRTLTATIAGGLLAVTAILVPATTAPAATADGRSCHHGIRSLGFLYEEQFVREYRAGNGHYHVVKHLPPSAPINTHTHTVKCGEYVGGKLIHWRAY